MYGKGDRIVKGTDRRSIVMQRMPGEAMDSGYRLGERFGGEQMPTKYQSYTTGGMIYDDFSAPEHVDEFSLYGE